MARTSRRVFLAGVVLAGVLGPIAALAPAQAAPLPCAVVNPASTSCSLTPSLSTYRVQYRVVAPAGTTWRVYAVASDGLLYVFASDSQGSSKSGNITDNLGVCWPDFMPCTWSLYISSGTAAVGVLRALN